MKTIIFVPGVSDKYHFGSKDWESSRLCCPSHTLFSAIVNNFSVLFGKENLESLKNLKVSGVFPCILDKENKPIVYFVPKPVGNLNINKDYIKNKAKKLKKVEFVSLGFIKKQNNGELSQKDFEIIGEKFLITIEEFEKLCELITGSKNPNKNRKEEIKEIKLIGTQNEIKTSVDRMKGSSLEGNLYASSFIKPLRYYKDNDKKEITFKVGFLAVIEMDKNEEIERSIKMIKYNGLGGEISIGAGLFEKIEILDKNILEDLNGSKYMSLSSHVPTEEEWKDNKNWNYQIEKYYGWMFSYVNPEVIGKPKKSTYYITPGSVFDKQVNGKCVDLGDEKNACWFNGKPILIKITLGDKNEM